MNKKVIKFQKVKKMLESKGFTVKVDAEYQAGMLVSKLTATKEDYKITVTKYGELKSLTLFFKKGAKVYDLTAKEILEITGEYLAKTQEQAIKLLEVLFTQAAETTTEVAAEELEQLVEQAGNSVLSMEAEALEIYENIKANSSDDTYWAAWEMVNTFSTKCFNVWHDSENIINDEKLIRKEFEALKNELSRFLKPSSATIKEVAAEAAEAAAEALEASLTAEAEAVAANHSEEAEAAAEAAATVAALTEEHQERAEKCNFMYNRIKDYVIRLERAMDKYSVTREMYQEAKELYAEVRLTLLDVEAAIDSFIAAAESTDLYYSKKAFLELQAAYDIFVICYIDRIKKTIRAMRHFNNMSTAKASEVAETTEAAAEAAATAEALETQEETEAAAVADLVATDKYCNYILVTFNDGSQHIRSVPKPGSSQKASVFGNVRYFKQRYAANPKKFKLSPLGLDVINS